MATTLRTELTAAGCNVATATIVFQDGLGSGSKGPGVPDVSPTARGGRSTTGGTDARLDYKFVVGYGGGGNVPKCIAIDANAVYVWVQTGFRTTRSAAGNSGFRKIPITATQYVAGNIDIPVISLA